MSKPPYVPPFVPFDLDPDPESKGSWPEYLAGRWDDLPPWAKVFLGVFIGCSVLAGFVGLAVWFFQHGWTIPGAICVIAAIAAGVTMLAALITEGFDL